MEEKMPNINVAGGLNGNMTFGDNYGSIKNVQDSYNTNQPSEKQSLADAAEEIQRLLKQLEETNPTATELEQISYVNVATQPVLKHRAVAALKKGGEAAIDEFIQENKYFKVMKAIAKGWLQPNS